MMCSHDNTLKANKSKEGDVCLYDKINDSLFFVKIQDVESDIYPSDSYTPIGVVVVPGTHNVYGTGECAVICLSDLYTKLSNNSYYNTTRDMCWGIYNTTTTTFHTMVPYVAEYKQQREDSTIEGYIKLKKFYSDDPEPTFATDDTEYADELCLHDTNRYYYVNYVYIRYAPSPYFTDGTRNPNYYNIIE